VPDTITVGIVQMRTGPVKKNNLERAGELVQMAARKGAQVVVLPEMFACPYDLRSFLSEAESLPDGTTVRALSAFSRQNGIWLVGGSFPETSAERIYNTSPVFSPQGKLVAFHRKVHLFDVAFRELRVRESAVFTAGEHCTLVDTPWGKIGVMVCYDIRFPEFSRLYAVRGARLVFVPAAFNEVTGPLHWEMLFRCRALDNQVFMIASSPAPCPGANYQAWGQSMIADPMGKVLGMLDREEGILVRELDVTGTEHARAVLPLLLHRRKDIYSLGREEE